MLVAQRIVQDALRDHRKPGDLLLPERTMVEKYGAGRGTVREALRLLEVQGVISLKPGPRGGPVLRTPDGSELSFFSMVATFGTPLDVTLSELAIEAFSDLATTTEDIDTGQLATALDTVANTFRDSPDEVRAAVDGLGRLSRTVASRDAQLRELLQHANGVTGVLADRNKELVSLLTDGDLLLQELRKRRADIHTLLVSTVTLSQQLTGLVRENRAAIGPALANLKNVLATLEANQANLDRSIRLVAPFVRVFANTTGNGRWFDTYIQNLVPVPGGPGSAT